MIGTHNSATGLSSRWWIFRPFSFLWRTQTKTLEQQIAEGVKYLDLRVRWRRNRWEYCHGIVGLRGGASYLSQIASFCKEHNVKARLLLENGNAKTEKWFRTCAQTIVDSPEITFIGIKKGWKVIKNHDPHIIDYSYVPFYSNKSFWWNLKHMEWSTIASWAKKHNPPITDEIVNDTTVHFMDRF